MNGFFDMRHQYETKFYGCKHILLEEYMIIWDELIPRKTDDSVLVHNARSEASSEDVLANSYPMASR
jgi:hypothetical protein